jgi:hypothetical protein
MIDANTFEYGDLRVKIISKDYAGMVDTIYHGVMNDIIDKYSVMIELHDVNSGNDVAYNYPSGTSRYAFFEVTNKDRNYTSNASRLTLTTGLEGIEFQESAGRKVRMIHNTTSSAIALNTNTMPSPFTKTRMIKSWDEATMISLTVSGGNTTIPYTSIPAYSHIMVINSNISDDFMAGYKTFDSIFSSPISTKLDFPKFKNVNGLAPIIVNGIISVNKLLFENDSNIVIYDLKGNEIKKVCCSSLSSDLKINISNHPNGVYMLNIISDSGKRKSFKILKQ